MLVQKIARTPMRFGVNLGISPGWESFKGRDNFSGPVQGSFRGKLADKFGV